MFEGNYVLTRDVVQRLARIVFARFLRLHPKAWIGHLGLRLEIVGHDVGMFVDQQEKYNDINHAGYKSLSHCQK